MAFNAPGKKFRGTVRDPHVVPLGESAVGGRLPRPRQAADGERSARRLARAYAPGGCRLASRTTLVPVVVSCDAEFWRNMVGVPDVVAREGGCAVGAGIGLPEAARLLSLSQRVRRAALPARGDGAPRPVRVQRAARSAPASVLRPLRQQKQGGEHVLPEGFAAMRESV